MDFWWKSSHAPLSLPLKHNREKCPNVRSLRLRRGLAHFSELSPSMKFPQHLVELDLSFSNALSGEIIALFPSSLEKLNISSSLARSFRTDHLVNLQQLIWCGCDIRLDEALPALTNLPKLRHLALSDTFSLRVS